MQPVLVSFAVTLLSAAAAGGDPTPSPALIVLNKADNVMAIINPANGKVVATIPVGRDPHEAAVSDDGKLAFSSNMQGNSISVVDLTTQKEVERLPSTDILRARWPRISHKTRPAIAMRESAMNTNLPTGNATDPAMGATEPDPSGQRCYIASAEVEDILFDQLQYLVTHAGRGCPPDCLECGRLEYVKHWLLLPFQKSNGAAA